jgi:phosphomannomutase
MAPRGAPRRPRRAIPLLPQQQRAVQARHKDQWEGDRSSSGDRRRASAGSGPRPVLVRPSGTEPALRVMVEGRTRPRAELADSLATSRGALH